MEPTANKLRILALQAGVTVDKLVDNALERSKGNIPAAARDLGVTRATLYAYLKKRREAGCK